MNKILLLIILRKKCSKVELLYSPWKDIIFPLKLQSKVNIYLYLNIRLWYKRMDKLSLYLEIDCVLDWGHSFYLASFIRLTHFTNFMPAIRSNYVFLSKDLSEAGSDTYPPDKTSVGIKYQWCSSSFCFPHSTTKLFLNNNVM